MTINEKIYSLRKQNDLSQEELADKLNVSRQTISKWELGESNPDSDKIVPICELFDITTEELLRDKKIEKLESNNEDKPDILKAGLICGSILLYFLAIISIIIGEEMLHLNDGLVVSIFLFLCGLATAIIVFACMIRPGKKEETKEEKKDPILKGIISIITLIATCVYLFVSFKTGAWHITWIIWIIFATITKIAELIYMLVNTKEKENNNEE